MEFIFKTIVDCFEWKLSDQYMKYISYLAFRWVWGNSIGSILADRVSFVLERSPNTKISAIIRDCLGVLENAIRFKLVKYFSAYIDILRYILQEKNIEHLHLPIEPYHIYLEFGSCNRHALNLMALGLSRFSALHLEKKFDYSEDVEVEEYLSKLRTININKLDIPMLCKNEIRELI